MPATLAVFSGVPGSGKTTGIDYCHSEYGIPVVTKYSDRPPRRVALLVPGPGETTTVTRDGFDRLAAQPHVFRYEYRGYRYLVSLAEVRALLAAHRLVCMTSCNEGAPDLLADCLAGEACVVRVIVRANSDVVAQRLRVSGHTEREITDRMCESHQAAIAHNDAPTSLIVLDNNGDWASFERQLRNLAERYGAVPRPGNHSFQ